jgi:transcription antitermination protein NusB
LTARRRARELAFRVAYEADANHDAVDVVWQRLRDEEPLGKDPQELVDDIVRGLARDPAAVDARITAAAEHWPLDRMSATDRAVLRSAAAELSARAGTPARVVLDEAIDIARRFGSEDSARFVNGVLDRIARTLRPEEFKP